MATGATPTTLPTGMVDANPCPLVTIGWPYTVGFTTSKLQINDYSFE